MSKSWSPSCFLPGDLIEYRTGFTGHWRPGFVHLVERHRVTLQDGYSRRRVVIELGRRGKVRTLSGPRMVDTLASIQNAQRAQLRATLPQLAPVIVRTDGQPAAVPAPRRRYRSEAFQAFVRTWPCCNPHCQAPAPSDPHHSGRRGVGQKSDDYECVPCCRRCHGVVQDTYALPGCSRAETQEIIRAERERLLIEWAALCEGAAVPAAPAALAV